MMVIMLNFTYELKLLRCLRARFLVEEARNNEFNLPDDGLSGTELDTVASLAARGF